MTDTMDISQLVRQRRLTRAIAKLFTVELNNYLSTLAPLLNPRLVFGEFIHGGTKSTAVNAAKAFDELTSQYGAIYSSKPFNLRRQFETPVPLLSASLEITPASYHYNAQGEAGEKDIVVVSPLRWILSYEGFGPDRLHELMATTNNTKGPSLQQTVLHYLLLSITLEKRPGISDLLGALRFQTAVEKYDEFGQLPLVVITSPMVTSRPPDQVIIDSTEISGSSDFEEVVALDQLDQLADPLRDRIREVVASQGGA